MIEWIITFTVLILAGGLVLYYVIRQAKSQECENCPLADSCPKYHGMIKYESKTSFHEEKKQ